MNKYIFNIFLIVFCLLSFLITNKVSATDKCIITSKAPTYGGWSLSPASSPTQFDGHRFVTVSTSTPINKLYILKSLWIYGRSYPNSSTWQFKIYKESASIDNLISTQDVTVSSFGGASSYVWKEFVLPTPIATCASSTYIYGFALKSGVGNTTTLNYNNSYATKLYGGKDYGKTTIYTSGGGTPVWNENFQTDIGVRICGDVSSTATTTPAYCPAESATPNCPESSTTTDCMITQADYFGNNAEAQSEQKNLLSYLSVICLGSLYLYIRKNDT